VRTLCLLTHPPGWQWVRGDEWLRMTQPRAKPMAVLGLGGSIGTPPQGIVASVLVYVRAAWLVGWLAAWLSDDTRMAAAE